LSLVILLGLFVFFPFFLTDLLVSALGKLGLSPIGSLFVLMGIFFGSLINVPVKRIQRHRIVEVPAVGMFGLGWGIGRQVEKQRRDLIIAINVGGALIPSTMAVFELLRLAARGDLVPALACVGVNIFVCQRVARPIPGMGIGMPALVPGLVAVGCALLLAPDSAAPVAFASGVLGPLVGADLLHMHEIRRFDTPVVSIGGAGTFDGIVVSGMVALLLA
jgi:uncharacterized membrane protein